MGVARVSRLSALACDVLGLFTTFRDDSRALRAFAPAGPPTSTAPDCDQLRLDVIPFRRSHVCRFPLTLSYNIRSCLVGTETQEFWQSQTALSRPLREADLCNDLWLGPLHLFHLLCSDAAAPP